MIVTRNARAEATALLPSGFEARVLEPSPPTNADPAWFADDPTDASDDATVVTPIDGEGQTWADLVNDNPDLGGYAAAHWLDGRRRLEPLPKDFDATRKSIHQVGNFAVAPARYAATGKLGLRYTHRGFGTPFFGDDEQVRIEAGTLVHQKSGAVSTHEITTLRAAARFLGLDYEEDWYPDFHDPLVSVGPDTALPVDPVAADALGAWFGFTTLVLERTRRTPGAVNVSRVQLWPEHADSAIEIGGEGHRASYGASPGDAVHPEPYLYVAAWGSVDNTDPFWNDPNFSGASLNYSQLLESDDPYHLAISFFQEGHERLAPSL